MAYHKTSVLAAKAEAMRRAIEAADQSAGVAEISAVVNELELEEEPDSEALPAYVHTEAPSVQSEAADNELQAHSVLMETFTSDDNNGITGFDWAKYIQEMQSLPSHADDAADEDADEDADENADEDADEDANEDAVSSDTDSDADADVGKEEIEA
ncbi:hypothetical protein OF83DRAFT_1176534 [Amylostereum chailletii]|nr:hypothetical protein OF83DRAFT_1176534 [Amylostereum chailletii]